MLTRAPSFRLAQLASKCGSAATRWGRRFRRDRNGNVAMITGIAIIPTLAFLGFAVDYGVGLSNKAKLDAASDAASMAAITTAKSVIQNSTTTGSAVTATAVSQGQMAAAEAFRANAGAIPFASVPIPTVALTRVNQTLTATITYTGQMKTNFSGIFGMHTMNVSGKSTSTLTMPTYINYYIVVDSSQSMGIGSTATDMQNLFNRVIQYNNSSGNETGCVFGCHVQAPANAGGLQQHTNESLAHSVLPQITLRIDAAASAIQTIVSQAVAATQQSGQNLIALSLYTMQGDPTTGTNLHTLASLEYSPYLNTSAATVPNSTASNKLDLGNNISAGQGDSTFSASLNNFVTNVLTTQGDGSTNAAALNYVFIVTDGVSDIPNGCASCHAVAAFDDTICTPIKAKATVGVLYTTYNPIYNNNNPANGLEGNYAGLVGPIASQIVPNLQTCASSPTSQWYYEATDGPAITAGMQQLFANGATAARLSQ